MEYFILFFLSLGMCACTDLQFIKIGLTTTLGTELQKETIGPIEDNKSEESKERIRNLVETTGIGLRNNEADVTNENNFVRPCCMNDKKCIQEFLAKNSDCTPVDGPVPDPLNLSQKTEIAAVVNITVTFGNYMIRGLSNVKIVEFYYNKKTQNVLIAFEVTNINEVADTFFTYHRTAKESIVLYDITTIRFNSIIFTVTIPGPRFRLDLAQAHAFISESFPLFTVGPGLAASLDPDVIEGFASIALNVPTIVRELFLTKSQLYSAVIIQKSICDFGVPLYSV